MFGAVIALNLKAQVQSNLLQRFTTQEDIMQGISENGGMLRSTK
jgi:hypothetical protein